MAEALGTPKTNLQIMLKVGGGGMSHSITVKPTQTEYKIQQNIYFCVNYININWKIFEDTVDVVHINENQ